MKSNTARPAIKSSPRSTHKTMRPLLTFAMIEESRDLFTDHATLHTGIGKINAAHALVKSITNNRPDIVINLGTAGSPLFKTGTITNPTKFIQRDMNVTALGFVPYQTPFSDDPVIIEHGERVKHLPTGICGTGDSFDITSKTQIDYTIIDMEAYALALICQRENLPFLCLKYISDGADENANMDWNETLSQAATALRRTLDEYLAL